MSCGSYVSFNLLACAVLHFGSASFINFIYRGFVVKLLFLRVVLIISSYLSFGLIFWYLDSVDKQSNGLALYVFWYSTTCATTVGWSIFSLLEILLDFVYISRVMMASCSRNMH
jgi:hypothetical protein